jgi:hypothetical protein
LCDAQWRILDQLHGENYACQDNIDRKIIRHAKNDNRLLATCHTARGKNCHVEIYGRREKKSASELKVGKKICFLISEMEGRRIRNQKNIISEALAYTVKPKMLMCQFVNFASGSS